ncbi:MULTISPECIES: hypothetical protein [unclassified Allomuricauda]|uniref:hypothetical protein n=1 Tax=unclassified Allomuricauda TaxID=2615049 RepID=UPI00273FD3DE|nr:MULTISPECIES: hypothetical protein [unclassified Allomuricauda]
MSSLNKIKYFGIGHLICSFIIGIVLTISGCRGEKKVYKIDKRGNFGISLIEHPFVFEEENFQIKAFFVQKDSSTSEYVLNLCLTGDVSKFHYDHRAFVHAFKSLSDSNKSVNIVLNDPKIYGDSLVFSKSLRLKKDSLFEKVNFGVEDKITKERKFVLTLKNVDLQEFQRRE